MHMQNQNQIVMGSDQFARFTLHYPGTYVKVRFHNGPLKRRMKRMRRRMKRKRRRLKGLGELWLELRLRGEERRVSSKRTINVN